MIDYYSSTTRYKKKLNLITNLNEIREKKKLFPKYCVFFIRVEIEIGTSEFTILTYNAHQPLVLDPDG
jgi:hypothetical protein